MGIDDLYGGAGNDRLFGGAEGDILKGGDDHDTLRGGSGDDHLWGDTGNDTYIFQAGDGQDVIYDYEASDTIELTGINSSSITLSQSKGQDGADYLAIQYTANDVVFIKDWAGKDINVQLADGKLDMANLLTQDMSYQGTENADTITIANTGSTTIYAGAGDDNVTGNIGQDLIFSQAGNDKLTGGKGDDELQGGEGDDTYLFNLGDGKDTIFDASGADILKLGEGITQDKVKFIKGWNYLALTILGTNDSITIVNAFSDVNNQIEQVQFADGSTLNVAQIQAKIDAQTGQTINGTFNNDTLHGGQGNDLLKGGLGDDIYLFNSGDGHDTIDDTFYGGIQLPPGSSLDSGNDTLRFGQGITASQLSAERGRDSASNDLIIQVNDYDSITIKSWFNDTIVFNGITIIPPKIEHFEFADGTTWGGTQIEQFIDGEAINYAPIVVGTITDQQVDSNQAFDFVIPNGTFKDPEDGEVTLSATLADGSALPDWLSFNASTGQFSGVALQGDVGSYDLNIIATDAGGLSTSPLTFSFIVQSTNGLIKNGEEFLINTATSGHQREASATILQNGDTLLVWTSLFGRYLDKAAVTGQYFDEFGQKKGGEFAVSLTGSYPGKPSVTALSNGGAIVVWRYSDSSFSNYSIRGQQFDERGLAIGNEFSIDRFMHIGSDEPAVTATNDGGFLVVVEFTVSYLTPMDWHRRMMKYA